MGNPVFACPPVLFAGIPFLRDLRSFCGKSLRTFRFLRKHAGFLLGRIFSARRDCPRGRFSGSTFARAGHSRSQGIPTGGHPRGRGVLAVKVFPRAGTLAGGAFSQSRHSHGRAPSRAGYPHRQGIPTGKVSPQARHPRVQDNLAGKGMLQGMYSPETVCLSAFLFRSFVNH